MKPAHFSGPEISFGLYGETPDLCPIRTTVVRADRGAAALGLVGCVVGRGRGDERDAGACGREVEKGIAEPLGLHDQGQRWSSRRR